jgi:hypothetical protein
LESSCSYEPFNTSLFKVIAGRVLTHHQRREGPGADIELPARELGVPLSDEPKSASSVVLTALKIVILLAG